MSKPLTIEQKLAIVLAREKSLRALAEEYGVHHSTIAEICQESEALLRDYWTEKTKRIGRPAKPVDPPTAVAAQEKAALEKALALKEMRIDFLELKLSWAEARVQEAQGKIGKQLKKKKKSP